VHQEDENVPRTLKTHAAEADLLALALGREADAPRETRGHVTSCTTCARRAEGLASLADAVRLEEEIADELADAEPRPPSPRAAERRLRLAEAAARSDAALRDADALVESARDANADHDALVGSRIGTPDGRLALLYALQRANFTAGVPQRALAFASAVVAAAGRRIGEPGLAVLVGEARAIESHGFLSIGRLSEARESARAARRAHADAGSDAFSLAVCDYFEASVMCFQGEFGRAERLLGGAARVFAEHAQDHWVGRAEGMLASALSQRGDNRRALAAYDAALERLDPDQDASAVAACLLNRSRCLGALGRFEAAKQGFAQALQAARRHHLDALVFGVRQNLAELEMLRGDFEKALASFRAVAEEADRMGLEEDQVVTRLAAAECLGRLGRTDEMIAALRGIGRLVDVADLRGNPAWSELASRLDPGDVDVGLVSEVRRHLAAALDGYVLPFRASKRA
jgi:tetratricopeptide (TPR) repeat protein